MKKIAFYLLLLSIMTLQAAVYKGRTAYIGFCKDCHGNGTKMAKKHTGNQLKNMFCWIFSETDLFLSHFTFILCI